MAARAWGRLASRTCLRGHRRPERPRLDQCRRPVVRQACSPRTRTAACRSRPLASRGGILVGAVFAGGVFDIELRSLAARYSCVLLLGLRDPPPTRVNFAMAARPTAIPATRPRSHRRRTELRQRTASRVRGSVSRRRRDNERARAGLSARQLVRHAVRSSAQRNADAGASRAPLSGLALG